jgi:predicted  nucleic acid-binding Zn-ribbon protein
LSISDQIRALETLAALDAELKIMDEDLALERGALSGLQESIKTLDAKLEIDRAALAAGEKTRSELITDVRNMNLQLEHSRDKLGRSRSEREANAAQRELEELRKLIRDREDEAGKLTVDGDAVRQSIEATEAEHLRISQELAAREGHIREKVAQVEAARSRKGSEREAATKALPPVLYRRYDTIRAKKGVGIAQTSDGTCKACNMGLPPQLFHRLRREPTLDQCPSCFRIIYYKPPASAAQASASAKA